MGYGIFYSHLEGEAARRNRPVEEILEEGSCLQLKDLAIDGKDLMALGFHPGPELGKCLQALLNQVLDGAVSNEKEALLQKAREHLSEVPL